MITPYFDSNELIIIIGVFIIIGGLGTIIYGISTWLFSGNRVSARLDHYVAEKNPLKTDIINNRTMAREITGSLFNRTFSTWLRNLFRSIGKSAPASQITKLNHDLAIVRNPFNLKAIDFYVIKFLFLLTGVLIAVYINAFSFPLDFILVFIGAIVILIFFTAPNLWLNSKVKNFQEQIRRDLPDALDMLSVCASAGLGFDQSLQKISSYWNSFLGEELKRVTREMEMGVQRSTALKNLSDRLDVEDLTRFIAIINHAEKMGMSYADVLHSQASQMRILRQFRAKEFANKLPAKLILPLALLIFPALIAVIIGPIIPTLLDLF